MKIKSFENIWKNAKIIFIIVIIFHCVNNLFWFKLDGYGISGCHAVWHEQNAFECSKILLKEGTPFFQKTAQIVEFFKLSKYGYAFSNTNFNLTALFLAFPISSRLEGPIKLFLINIILFLQFVLVLAALYYLGKSIFNKDIGAWAAIIFSFYPGILGLSRKINSELLTTFFVIISVAIFIRWKGLPKIPRLFLLFIIFVLGTFSSGLFLIFFIPLFLLHLFYDFFSSDNKIQGLLQAIIFLCLALIFFNFYFDGEYLKVFLNLEKALKEAYQKLFFQSTNFIGSGAEGIMSSFVFASQDSICPCTQTTNVGMNIKTFLFYPMEIMYYTSALFFFLAIFSFFFFMRDKTIDFHKRMFCGVWVIFSYLVLSLFDIKWGKFITPLLPALALSSAIFICRPFKKTDLKKTSVFFIGIVTVLFYSYVPAPHTRFLQKIYEGIVSHRPIESRFVHVAEEISEVIKNDDINKRSNLINIAFLNTESPRFNNRWVADAALKFSHLISLFSSQECRITNFFSLSDDFYNRLHRKDFIVLVTREKIIEVEGCLYPKGREKISDLNFEIIYEDWLYKDVFVYVVAVD